MTSIEAQPRVTLDEAERLFAAGNYKESEALFRSVVPDAPYAAHYGLGMVYARLGDFDAAAREFQSALEADPLSVQALIRSGQVAEHRRKWEDAGVFYLMALQLDPSNENTARRIQLVGRKALQESPGSQTVVGSNSEVTTSAPERQAAAIPRRASDSAGDGADSPTVPERDSLSSHYGILDFLTLGQKVIPERTLEMLDDLRLHEKRPSFAAYLGRYLVRVAVATALVLALLYALLSPRLAHDRETVLSALDLPNPAYGNAGLFWVAAIACVLCVAAAWLLVAARSIRVTLHGGRIELRQGIFRRKIATFELWRVYHVKLEQTWMNRLTRDGSITLHFNPDYATSFEGQRKAQKGRPVVLVGIARGRRLFEIYRKMTNLVFYLRTNPELKGFVQ